MTEHFLKCTICSNQYSDHAPIWRCDCGGLLDLSMTPKLDPKKIRDRKPGLWRYREVLPIHDSDNIISFDEGFTPLVDVKINREDIKIKQDHLFQSGSYKDRGASILISKVKELGIKKVVEDSSGNAGCAIAAYSARANIQCDIYVPESTSTAKLTQISQYGAALYKIPGSREDTANAVLAAAQHTYYASHSWNPYFFHGTKTFAYELWEQLNGQSPQIIILPAGNGTLLLGAWIGFNELQQAGLIRDIPRLFTVQSAHCAPLYHAYQNELSEPASITTSPTLAEGIAIAEPVRGKQIMHAVRKSGGDFVIVNDDEVRSALRSMHQMGFYIEPTAAAAIAAIPKIQLIEQKTGHWVSVFTGHGLKSTKYF